MKHDERCEMNWFIDGQTVRNITCHCAERAYEADPFLDEDGQARYQRS